MRTEDNIALIVCRQQARVGDEWSQVFATSLITESCAISNVTREINYVFPLYLYPRIAKRGRKLFHHWGSGNDVRTPNLDSKFVEQICDATKLQFVSDGRGDLRKSLGPEDIVGYIYAVFHGPGYRDRYKAQLKLDFPRVPLPIDVNLFQDLAAAGRDLLAFHVLQSPELENTIIRYAGPREPEVRTVGWSNGTVWLDAGKTNAREGHRATKPGTFGFRGVPEKVWDYRIGSYQVCHKWLKDRKGLALTEGDIAHYQKIVVALNETICITQRIDQVVKAHGGWLDAFTFAPKQDPVVDITQTVVPLRPRKVQPKLGEHYVTCLPYIPLEELASQPDSLQHIEDDDLEWMAVESRHRLRKGMFLTRVTGKTMEPAILDGAWCVLLAPVEILRKNRIILVQLKNNADKETGRRYTVNCYKSKISINRESWNDNRITLQPVTAGLSPVIISRRQEDQPQIIAELVEVLGT